MVVVVVVGSRTDRQHVAELCIGCDQATRVWCGSNSSSDHMPCCFSACVD
jgi:hypothetical protein